MFPADFVKNLFIDSLPVDRFTFGFKFFDYRLYHPSFENLLSCHAGLSLAESALNAIESQCISPFFKC